MRSHRLIANRTIDAAHVCKGAPWAIPTERIDALKRTNFHHAGPRTRDLKQEELDSSATWQGGALCARTPAPRLSEDRHGGQSVDNPVNAVPLINRGGGVSFWCRLTRATPSLPRRATSASLLDCR